MSDLRYKDLEGTLARIFDVPKKEVAAFRARLRHLRNIGIPDLPKVGSGTQITYTRRHAFELLVALELTRAGVSPRYVRPLVKQAADDFEKLKGRFSGEKVSMQITGAGHGASVAASTDYLDLRERPFRHLTIVNLTACNEALPQHWK
jgi:hypothetical protein